MDIFHKSPTVDGLLVDGRVVGGCLFKLTVRLWYIQDHIVRPVNNLLGVMQASPFLQRRAGG